MTQGQGDVCLLSECIPESQFTQRWGAGKGLVHVQAPVKLLTQFLFFPFHLSPEGILALMQTKLMQNKQRGSLKNHQKDVNMIK